MGSGVIKQGLTVGCAALLLASVAGCASRDEAADVSQNRVATHCDGGSPSDPRSYYDSVEAIRKAPLLVVEPGSLAEALPGADSVTIPQTGELILSPWADVALTGAITSVRPGNGYIYSTTDVGDAAEIVDFHDSRAVSRDVLVTIEQDWSEGAAVDQPIDVRIGVLGGGDPDAFMDGLCGFHDHQVVAVLKHMENGPTAGDPLPIMQGGLLGTVEEDGSLSFPGLGEVEETFIGQLDTVDELKQAAREAAAKL